MIADEVEEQHSELADGWRWVRMLDILDYEGGSQPPKKEFIHEPKQGYVRLLQIRDFGEKPFPTYVPISSRLKTAKKDDLLLARYGGSSANDSLGRVCTGLEGAYNVALAKLVFDRDSLEASFVRALFQGPWFREKVSQNSRSCQTGFNREDVVDIWFPLAPLPEQKRIAVKLDALLAKVRTCQERLAHIPTLLKRFRQSVLAAACSGKLTADWRETEVSTIERTSSNEELPGSWSLGVLNRISKITSGYAFKSGDFTDEGIPAIKIANVQYGEFIEKGQEYLPWDFADRFAQFLVVPNTLLMALTRPITNDTLKVCLYPSQANNGLLNQRVCKIEPSDSVELEFLHLTMQTKSFRDQVADNVTETLQPNLSPKDLENFSIPLPPIAEQTEIVRRVNQLFQFADQIESRFQKARVQVERLTQSILAKAFRGELVETEAARARREGRDYETAEQLLERIKSQKPAEPQKRPRAPKRLPRAKPAKK